MNFNIKREGYFMKMSNKKLLLILAVSILVVSLLGLLGRQLPVQADYPSFVPDALSQRNKPIPGQRRQRRPVEQNFNPEDFYSSPKSAYSWPKFPAPRVAKSFSDEQRQLIWESLAQAQELLQRKEVYDCIGKYVNNGYFGTNPKGAVEIFLTQYPVNDRALGRPRRVYISKMYEENKILGQAILGLTIQQPNERAKDFALSLNAYNLSNPRFNKNTWAGVIVHEILHNWNYDHVDNVVINSETNQTNVAGNFVYESGWCVAREGRDKEPGTFGLTGSGGADVFVD
ncbi:hypothetical protein QT990_26545 [Microcoleus sp. T3_B1]|uniref:hypothetical protein n=1 Tax=Microcoleus sp. B7-D4 TaxID=2818696 RepID=UPI002FD20211